MNTTPPPHPGPPYLYAHGMHFKAYTCRVHEVDADGLPLEMSPVYDHTITEATPQPEDDMWVHTYILCYMTPAVYDRKPEPEQETPDE